MWVEQSVVLCPYDNSCLGNGDAIQFFFSSFDRIIDSSDDSFSQINLRCQRFKLQEWASNPFLVHMERLTWSSEYEITCVQKKLKKDSKKTGFFAPAIIWKMSGIGYQNKKGQKLMFKVFLSYKM